MEDKTSNHNNKRLRNNYAQKQKHSKSSSGYDWYLPKFLQHDSGVDDVLVAPTFYPTAEEFKDPMAYMAKIIPQAEKYGLCKIVPPEEHELPTSLEQLGFKKKDFKFTTKIQNIHLLQSRGKEYKDGDNGFFSDITEAAMAPVVATPPDPKQTPSKRSRSLGEPLLSPDAKKQKNEMLQAPPQSPDAKSPLLFAPLTPATPSSFSSPFYSSISNEVGDYNFFPPPFKQEEKNMLPPQPQKPQAVPQDAPQERSRMMSHFGFERSQFEFNLVKFQQMADSTRDKYFSEKINFHKSKNLELPTLPAPLKRKLARRGGLQRVRQLCYYDDLSEVTEADVECEYWKTVENGKHQVTVHYGSDLAVNVVGSGFPKNYKIGWNTTRLAQQPRSLLNYMPQSVSGINSPMMYVGMLFSSFCWHTEDNYLFSINYIHSGACKSWYSIPSSAYKQFEIAMRETLPELFEAQPNLLHMLITMLSPRVLRAKNVPIYKMLHEAGTYMITFPRSYHAGFNHGFNVAESVNFAPPNWVAYGRHAVVNYRKCHRQTAFSHEELIVNTARNFKIFEQGDYELIRNELQNVIDDEEASRKRILGAYSFGKVEEREDFTINKKNLRRVSSKAEEENVTCEHCLQDCYLSFITNKQRSRFSCLRDFEKMNEHEADCSYSYRKLDQLYDMVKEIDKAIYKFKHPEVVDDDEEEQ